MPTSGRPIPRSTDWPPTSSTPELDLTALATVEVTSEQSLFPIENVFSGRRGPRESCWNAATPGPQSVIISFKAPQRVDTVSIESEEHAHERTQVITLSISRDDGVTYQELLRQEFNFSPYGATFQRETWKLPDGAVTHVRLDILPHKGGGEAHASLTSLVLR